MNLLTPTTSVPDAILCHFLAADPANADRIYRAAELVSHVEPSRGTRDLWLCYSASEPNRAYQVDATSCSCPDFQKRGGWCKHRLALAMFQALERADAEQADPPPTREPETCYACGRAAGIVTYYPDGVRHAGCAPVVLTVRVAPEDEAIPYRLVPTPAPRPTAAVAYSELYGDGPAGGLY